MKLVQIPYRPEFFFFRPYFHYCLNSGHYCVDHFHSHNMNYIRLFQTNQQLNGWEYSLESYVFSRGMTVDVNISSRLWFNVSVAHEIPDYSRFFTPRWVNIWAIQSQCTTTRASKITTVTKITVMFKRSENRNHYIRVTQGFISKFHETTKEKFFLGFH